VDVALRCRNLRFTFHGQAGAVSALEDVTLELHDDEFVCIVGPSGCGKTTLLKLMAGLLAPMAGSIELDEPRNGRPRNALAFQEHALFPWMSVMDNVSYGLRMQGAGKRASRERAQQFIELVGLERFARSYPHELSVGMRQRASIARAFVADPEMLLMDEPFGSLDALTKLILQEELLRIWSVHRKLVVYVTHDIGEAVLLADRVLVMSGRPGRIRREFHIPLERPRDLRDREQPEIVWIREEIWNVLEQEVRTNLGGAR
jgi:NitT/TauT family transport system ATP-binding protein